MAQFSAERQRAYRARRRTAHGGAGERPLNAWVRMEVDLALGRLARRYAVTKRAMLERLILEADDAEIQSLDPDTAAWDAYFGRR
ncbi:hypothetical protein LRF89_12455 [Halorhodospira sp. 9621]|uniref:hypothetical protein n=1 Tax=Halorhodospira sp. 9621 TaxID=2899135 RepID=UPI001EE927DE|nr:hypothetical protein [Halorhodospira sp. 9621]MCG5534246.1 hypothetical protein [Halorhodospira sp. 9621]